MRKIFMAASVCGLSVGLSAHAAQDCNIPTHVGSSEYSRIADLFYTTSPNAQQSLDLYLPAKVTNPPIVISIHGGGFRHGNKQGERAFAEVLAHYGIATATLNYRLTTKDGQNLFPAGISDVRCAASWLQANGASLGIDATRFAVFGGSAGGSLGSLLGLGANPGGAFDATPNCAVPIAPPAALGIADYFGLNEFDNPAALNHFQTVIAKEYLGIKPELDPSLAQEASPITYVAHGVPPFFVARGTKDTVMPRKQATDLNHALRLATVAVQYWDIPGLGHAFQPFDVANNPILEASGCALVSFYQGVFGIDAGAASPAASQTP